MKKILLLLIILIIPVFVNADFTKEDCKCSIPGATFTDGYGHVGLGCSYKWTKADAIIGFSVSSYETEEKMKKNFPLVVNNFHPSNGKGLHIYENTADRVVVQSEPGLSLKSLRLVRIGRFYIKIYNVPTLNRRETYTNSEVTAIYDALEACGKTAISKQVPVSKSGLTLQNVEPWKNNKPGGEIIATLKDENEKPITNKIIFFYVEKDDDLHNILTAFSGRPKGSTKTWDDFLVEDIGNVDKQSTLGFAITDKKGVAKISYRNDYRLKMQKLAEALIPKGYVEGTVKAFSVDKKDWKPEEFSETKVKFDQIAKITSITGQGVPDKPPKGQTQYVVSGPGKVRVSRTLVEPFSKNKEAKVNEKLMPGDVVNIDGDTEIGIEWINKNSVTAKIPKSILLGEGKQSQQVGSMSIILLATAFDSGFLTTYERLTNMFTGFSVEKGVGLLIDTAKDLLPGIVKTGGEFTMDIIKSAQQEFNDVDLSKYSTITKVRVKSTIVVDSAEEINIYTVEGNPDVKTPSGEVSLVADQYVNIDKDLKLSSVEKFDSDELTEWSSEIEEAMEEKESAGITMPEMNFEFDGIKKPLMYFGIIFVVVIYALNLIKKGKKKK